jgi:hypothetical protein
MQLARHLDGILAAGTNEIPDLFGLLTQVLQGRVGGQRIGQHRGLLPGCACGPHRQAERRIRLSITIAENRAGSALRADRKRPGTLLRR